MERDIILGLDKLGEELLVDFAQELITQGHRATGKLIASLRKNTLITGDGYRLIFTANDYGLYLETGRKKGKYVGCCQRYGLNRERGEADCLCH